jgi:hypothetical protein
VTLPTLLGSVYKIELQTKFNLIHEKEWTGDTVTDICARYQISRKSYYKWKLNNAVSILNKVRLFHLLLTNVIFIGNWAMFGL